MFNLKLRPLKNRAYLLVFMLLFVVSFQIASAAPGDIERVSVDSSGGEADNASSNPSISSDGRYVAFASGASNLVSGDTGDRVDIFVHDRQTGTTTRVSVDSSGIQGNNSSFDPVISGDGRYVAFRSTASNLVSGDSNDADDIFVHDRQTGTTTRVSVSSSGSQGNSGSFEPAISDNGRYIAFQSLATNLVSGDNNTYRDIFVHDQQTGETTRVSVDSSGGQSNDNSFDLALSGNGRYVAFESLANNLVSGDTNNASDIFVHDRDTGVTERVSVDSSGNQSNGGSLAASISGDGRFVTFHANATNLVSGDTNNRQDIFVHNRQTGETTRVSVDSSGVAGNNDSTNPTISSNGRFVAFEADASNLVSGDNNNDRDVFVHDRNTGETTRVSVDSSGVEGNGMSWEPAISSDGSYIAFASQASNLVSGDSNSSNDVFVAEPSFPDPDATSCEVASGFNVIHGTAGNDKIKGTAGNDIIYGYGGNDRLEGMGGNDCLIGGPGDDKLYGDEGNDILWGGEVDNATIYDSKDRDKLYGNDGDDELHGGGDKDRLDGNDGNDWLYGDDGDDTMVGHDGDDTMYGGNGRDNMRGDDGNDSMYGEAGDDRLYGRQGDDTLDGGDNNDQLDGSAGTDTCIDGEKLKSCEL